MTFIVLKNGQDTRQDIEAIDKTDAHEKLMELIGAESIIDTLEYSLVAFR